MTETTGRGKQFLKSVGIYAVGNIGSKLITFLMIPLYTFFFLSRRLSSVITTCVLRRLCCLRVLLRCNSATGRSAF